MATNQAVALTTAPNLSFSLIRLLSLPWLDLTIAAITCVPKVRARWIPYLL
jgi:hypothetical protein